MAGHRIGAHIITQTVGVPSSAQFQRAAEALRRHHRLRSGLRASSKPSTSSGDDGVEEVSLDGLRDRLRTLHGWLQRATEGIPPPDDTVGLMELYLGADSEVAAQILFVKDEE